MDDIQFIEKQLLNLWHNSITSINNICFKYEMILSEPIKFDDDVRILFSIEYKFKSAIINNEKFKTLEELFNYLKKLINGKNLNWQLNVNYLN